MLLIETIFDTLNAKAAIWAARRHAADTGIATPLMISGTITDRSGRTLSGQTTTAFWQSIRHSDPLSVGLNCALGGADMRPYIQELATVADTLICAYPNAGLPNALGCYDETPDQTAAILGEFADAGFVNIVGGCCGTTPCAHHRHCRSRRRQDATPSRRASSRPAALRPRTVHAHRRHPVRQRRRAHQRHRIGEVPPPDHQRRLRRSTAHRSRSGRERCADHRRQHGRGPARLEAGDDHLPQPDRRRARHRPCPGDDRFVEVRRDRGRARMRAGQGGRQLDLDEGRSRPVPRPGPRVP